MGSRGKKRRRANGEIASGKTLPTSQRYGPLELEFNETIIGPVPANLLARAITITNRYLPIDIVDLRAVEAGDGVDGTFDRGYQLEAEIAELAGSEVSAVDLETRARILTILLRRENPLFHTIDDDGRVVIDRELLEYAASTELTDHPETTLHWPVSQA